MAQSVNNNTESINQYGQKLMLDGGKRLSLNGVESVDGFTETEIRLSSAGNKVVITGSSIKITSFNKSSGSLTAEGNITGIKYGEKKGSFFKRLFS